MTREHDSKRFLEELSRFRPGSEQVPRSLAVYSAAIALAEENAIKAASQKAFELGAGAGAIYEIMLQSYLFLGFPRMLTAAECFLETFPEFAEMLNAAEIGYDQFEHWYKRGTSLCQKVYAANYEKLKNRVRLFSPEIFDWMILEGYGKVLSRPGLDIKVRELGIVACLMVEKRPKQLYSHIRGALNVGVNEKTLKVVIGDIGLITGADKQTALSYMKRLQADD